METKEKGCVYFFKHVGLEPIKIGFSKRNNPINRFEQFRTYAPFGSELIGFFQTDEPNLIEKELHQKYSSNRLSGEWFNISVEEAEKIINLYTSKEQIKEKNDFQIAYAKSLEQAKYIKELNFERQNKHFLDKNFETYFDVKSDNSNREKVLAIYKKQPNFNRTKVSEMLNVSKTTIYKYLNEIIK
jgi:hypothetical protein